MELSNISLIVLDLLTLFGMILSVLYIIKASIVNYLILKAVKEKKIDETSTNFPYILIAMAYAITYILYKILN